MIQDRRTYNPSNPDLPTKRQIETQLHTKLEAARIEYESASESYKSALRHCDEHRLTHQGANGNGDLQPRVEESVSKSVKAQHDAFEAYRRALDTFNKFILYGDLPDQPD